MPLMKNDPKKIGHTNLLGKLPQTTLKSISRSAASKKLHAANLALKAEEAKNRREYFDSVRAGKKADPVMTSSYTRGYKLSLRIRNGELKVASLSKQQAADFFLYKSDDSTSMMDMVLALFEQPKLGLCNGDGTPVASTSEGDDITVDCGHSAAAVDSYKKKMAADAAAEAAQTAVSNDESNPTTNQIETQMPSNETAAPCAQTKPDGGDDVKPVVTPNDSDAGNGGETQVAMNVDKPAAAPSVAVVPASAADSATPAAVAASDSAPADDDSSLVADVSTPSTADAAMAAAGDDGSGLAIAALTAGSVLKTSVVDSKTVAELSAENWSEASDSEVETPPTVTAVAAAKRSNAWLATEVKTKAQKNAEKAARRAEARQERLAAQPAVADPPRKGKGKGKLIAPQTAPDTSMLDSASPAVAKKAPVQPAALVKVEAADTTAAAVAPKAGKPEPAKPPVTVAAPDGLSKLKRTAQHKRKDGTIKVTRYLSEYDESLLATGATVCVDVNFAELGQPYIYRKVSGVVAHNGYNAAKKTCRIILDKSSLPTDVAQPAWMVTNSHEGKRDILVTSNLIDINEVKHDSSLVIADSLGVPIGSVLQGRVDAEAASFTVVVDKATSRGKPTDQLTAKVRATTDKTELQCLTNENAALKLKLAFMEAELSACQSVKEEVLELRRKNAQLETDLADAQGLVCELDGELTAAAAKASVTGMAATGNELATSICCARDLQQALDKERHDKKALELAYTGTLARINSLECANRRLTKENSAMATATAEPPAEVVNALRSSRALLDQVAELNAKLDARVAELEDDTALLKATNDKMKSQLAATEDQLLARDRRIDVLRDEFEEISALYDGCNRWIKTAESEMSSLRKSLADKDQELAAAVNSLQGKSEEVSVLELKLEEQTKLHHGCRSRLVGTASDNIALRKQIELSKQQCLDAEAKVASAGPHGADVLAELAASKKQCEELAHRLQVTDANYKAQVAAADVHSRTCSAYFYEIAQLKELMEKSGVRVPAPAQATPDHGSAAVVTVSKTEQSPAAVAATSKTEKNKQEQIMIATRERQVDEPAITDKKKKVVPRPEPADEPERRVDQRRSNGRSKGSRQQADDQDEPEPQERVGAGRGMKYRYAELLAAKRGVPLVEPEPEVVPAERRQADLDDLPRAERLAIIRAARERMTRRATIDNQDEQQGDAQ